MKGIASRYAAFVRRPDVARLLLAAFVARMPNGMLAFSMLMFLREAMGDFTLAGSAVGLNFLAMAISAPILGRLIDRYGPRIPLLVAGTLQPLALLGVLLSASELLPFAVVGFFAAMAGVFASPITTLTRAIWRHRFEHEDDRRTAFALDAVTLEINFSAGPAIVAAMLATVGSRVAFMTAIAIVVVSIVVYVRSGVLELFRRVTTAERSLLGPLTDSRLWLVFVATFGLTLGFGLLEVAYPAFGTSIAMPPLGGVLLAINSLGSAVGGIVYGGMHLRLAVDRQFAIALGLMAIPLLLHAHFQVPAAYAVLAFIAGGLIAPSIAAQSVLVSRLAPAKYATEAFTWSSMFFLTGVGGGVALGGAVIENAGLPTVFLIGALVMTAMALLIWVGLRCREMGQIDRKT